MEDLEPDLNSNVQNRETREGELAEDICKRKGLKLDTLDTKCHVSEEHASAYIH